MSQENEKEISAKTTEGASLKSPGATIDDAPRPQTGNTAGTTVKDQPKPRLVPVSDSESKKKKDKRDGKPREKAEDSVHLRWTAMVMSVLLISGACAYLKVDPKLTFLFICMAMMGAFLSHHFREKRPLWYQLLAAVGAIVVTGTLFVDLYHQWQIRNITLLSSVTLALAGLQAIHCFDLRTRADFGISALIGATLLVATAGVASDGSFALWIFFYFACLAALFYSDAVSRSKEIGPSRPVGEGRPASMPKAPKRAQSMSSSMVVLVPIVSLPLLTLLMSFFLPRTDSLISWVTENFIRPNIAISRGSPSSTSGPGGGGGGSQSGGGGGSAATSGDTNSGGQGSMGAIDPQGGSGDGTEGLGSKEEGTGIDDVPFEETAVEDPEELDLLQEGVPSDQVMLKISAPKASYTRMLSFDTYNGKSWTRTGPMTGITFKKHGAEGTAFLVNNANALLLPPDCKYVEIKQHVMQETDSHGQFVAAYWTPQAIAGPFENVTVMSDGSVKSETQLEAGMSYNVRSFVPELNPRLLTKLPAKTRSDFQASLLGPSITRLKKAEEELFERYLQLPSELPKRVKSLAKKVSGKTGNNFVRAERIKKHLSKKSYEFKESDVYRIKEGDLVYNFLFKTNEGNCKEYASTFVVLARASGIPARLVSGYRPGKYNKRTGFWEVKARDRHAWAEIYLPNWGWISFDPSPDGSLPNMKEKEGWLSQMTEGLEDSLARFGSAFNRRPATSAGAGLGDGISGSKLEKELKKKDDPEKSAQAEEEKDAFSSLGSHAALAVIVFSFVLACGLSVVWVLMQQRTTKPTDKLPDDAPRSTVLFFQVLKALKRYKISRAPTDTPDDLTAKISLVLESRRQEGKTVPSELEPTVEKFMEAYSLERFGKSERVEELERLSARIKELVS